MGPKNELPSSAPKPEVEAPKAPPVATPVSVNLGRHHWHFVLENAKQNLRQALSPESLRLQTEGAAFAERVHANDPDALAELGLDANRNYMAQGAVAQGRGGTRGGTAGQAGGQHHWGRDIAIAAGTTTAVITGVAVADEVMGDPLGINNLFKDNNGGVVVPPPTEKPSDQPTQQPTESPTSIPTPTAEHTPTATPTIEPIPTMTPPSESPTPTPTVEPTPTPTPTETVPDTKDVVKIIESIAQFDAGGELESSNGDLRVNYSRSLLDGAGIASISIDKMVMEKGHDAVVSETYKAAKKYGGQNGATIDLGDNKNSFSVNLNSVDVIQYSLSLDQFSQAGQQFMAADIEVVKPPGDNYMLVFQNGKLYFIGHSSFGLDVPADWDRKDAATRIIGEGPANLVQALKTAATINNSDAPLTAADPVYAAFSLDKSNDWGYTGARGDVGIEFK